MQGTVDVDALAVGLVHLRGELHAEMTVRKCVHVESGAGSRNAGRHCRQSFGEGQLQTIWGPSKKGCTSRLTNLGPTFVLLLLLRAWKRLLRKGCTANANPGWTKH